MQSFSYLVGVPGFEPGASWTRTKRDTKLRHAPMCSQPIYYKCTDAFCQGVVVSLWWNFFGGWQNTD